MTGRPPSYMRRQHQPKAAGREALPTELEKDFQARVVHLAQLKGYRLIYHTWNSERSAKGYPDLTLVRLARNGRPARLVFLELKRAGGRATAEQLAWIAALAQVPGVDAMVAWPEDLQALEELLT